MFRTAIVVAGLSLLFTLAGCEAMPDVATSEAALCVPNFDGQGAWLDSAGGCHYFAGGGASVRHATAPAGTSIVNVAIAATGWSLLAIAGNSYSPLAWSYNANDIPTWNGGANYVEDRFTNGDSRPPRFPAYSLSWTAGVYSTSAAQFPNPPFCPRAPLPGHTASCGTTANSGQQDMVGNDSPSNDQHCCQITSQFPDFESGRPCFDGSYVFNYGCPLH